MSPGEGPGEVQEEVQEEIQKSVMEGSGMVQKCLGCVQEASGRASGVRQLI